MPRRPGVATPLGAIAAKAAPTGAVDAPRMCAELGVGCIPTVITVDTDPVPVYEKLLFLIHAAKGLRENMIKIDFEKMGGLIPAVIQDYENGEVLMVAFMDQKTLDLTLRDGKTWFFSRTRNKYWMKGEESGNTQDVMEILTDCDADTVVIKVKQNGPAACHTGNRSCFYVKYENGEWVEHSNPLFDPAEVYKK
jgi:phosphoribosyl-AMP cyclohydrolase